MVPLPTTIGAPFSISKNLRARQPTCAQPSMRHGLRSCASAQRCSGRSALSRRSTCGARAAALSAAPTRRCHLARVRARVRARARARARARVRAGARAGITRARARFRLRFSVRHGVQHGAATARARSRGRGWSPLGTWRSPPLPSCRRPSWRRWRPPPCWWRLSRH